VEARDVVVVWVGFERGLVLRATTDAEVLLFDLA